MRRRSLLAVASAALAAAAGCTTLDSSRSPEYDCARARRPEQAAPDRPEAVEPASYPDPPTNPASDDRLVAFATAFEEAYRQNRLVGAEGDDLTGFGFHTEDTWTESAPAGAGVAGVQYNFYYEVRPDDAERPVHADSPSHTAVYYVDGSVALRAHEEGRREPTDAPDPREDGSEVACWE